jgi:hypothetical protein
MSYPTYQQTEELRIGQVELTSYSELECVHLQVEYSLETKDVLALILYCIDNHCGISLYSKSQGDAAKLEGVDIHRTTFPLNSLDQQRYARDFMDLYHSLQEPVIILPQVLIGELVLEALEKFYLLDYEDTNSPVYPHFEVLLQSTLMSGKIQLI